jgi:hypothetical protein
MKGNENRDKSTTTNVAIVGFVFGVITVIVVVFALKGC